MTTQSPSPSQSPRVSSRPVPLACTECRKRHVRCDAKQPCSRCLANNLRCTFTPSRRGHRHESSAKTNNNLTSSRTRVPSSDAPPRRTDNSNPRSPEVRGFYGVATDGMLSLETASRSDNTLETENQACSTAGNERSMTSKLETEKHVSLYYLYFHPAHPILVPQKVHASRNYPDYLQHVIQYIGSHYLPVPTTTLYSGIMAELCRTDIKSPCMVQARLLYSIALNGCNDIKNAQWILAAAVQLALELGMNERDFAEIHSGGLPIEAESLRRTWWELYVVDGYMAALWRKSGFSANSVDPDVLLPCEESLYSEGACASQSPSFSQFNRRYFVDDDINFSSFCYRIDAVRILARVLALTANQEVNDDEVQAVDNALAGWVLHLPYTKSEIINTFGEVDEILFQAHMIIQYANIYLHFPRSNLLHTLAANADITGSQKDLKAPPTSTQHIHTVKAIEASKHLSNLAALRLPNQRHTPFFICGLVLGAVVQLSACSAHNGRCAEQHRDRIILILGVLKSLRRTWSLTRIVCQQLKKVAVEVFESERPKSRGNPMTAEDMITAPTLDPDDQTWFENFDIQALQNMMHFDTRMIYSETI